MKTKRLSCLLLTVVTLGIGACHKANPVEDMEKAATALDKVEKVPATAPGAEAGEYDPTKDTPPSKQLKDAITDYKAGKMEDAVTRLQLLRAQSSLSPQQRMALQDSIASVMAEIYVLAEKGDARAIAAKAQYEKMQTQR